jgi:nucleoredoxin
MRFFFAGALSLGIAFVTLAANQPPMTAKDVSLMLRSGYSSDAVQRELTVRHFVGTLDAAGEKNLVQAGASPALISGLKAGAFAIPAGELAAVQAELAAREQRKAAQLEESQKLNTLYQARLMEKRNAPAAASAGVQGGNIASLVKGALVNSRNGVLQPYVDAEFEKKKVIGLYASAHWCGPCREFTPKLVAFYNKVAAAHPEFEIVFVSNDKTAPAMEGYMRENQMPWPALSFEKIAGNGALMKFFGDSIPCLVIVDESGKVLFDTYAGKDYRGPNAVLADLDRFFAGKNSSAQLAQSH